MDIFPLRQFRPSGSEIIRPSARTLAVYGDFADEAAAILTARGWSIAAPGNMVVDTVLARE